MNTTLIPYLRYSPRPKHAADRCNSPEVQLAACQRYATLIGVTLSEPVSDPLVSARKVRLSDRLGGQELLQRLVHGSGVVAQRLDRVFRDAADGITTLKGWRERGISLHLADQGGCAINGDSATGRLILHTLLVMAEFEPDMVAERTAASMAWKQQNGRRMGRHAPYGWRIDPDSPRHPQSGLATELIKDAAEQEVIILVRSLQSQSVSLREIGRTLEQQGIFCRGGTWHHGTLRRILNRRTR